MLQGAHALDAPLEPEAPAVAVPLPEVLASLRRELEEKTRALQAAVSSGGIRLAASVVEHASAQQPPPEQLQRLLGLRSGEAVLTAEEAEERSRKLPPGYKYVSVPAMAPRNGRDVSFRDELPAAKAARVGGGRATPGGLRGRAASGFAPESHGQYAAPPPPQQQRGAGAGARVALTPAEAEAKRKAAEKERRLNVKKKIAELSALVDTIATSVAAAGRERTRAASSAAAGASLPSAEGDGRPTSTAAVVWGEQTAQAKLEAVRTRRLQDICVRHALAAVRQLQAHKWAWPFNEPVDAVKMNLVDYHKIVTRPMDLGTVRARLEAAGAGSAAAAAAGVPAVGGFYNHPDEVAVDVRQVFANAMAYNPSGSDVYIMAATLAAAFETRWAASVAPKVAEAATAAAAEADRAAQRVAAAAATRAAEGAERRVRDLERALAAAEAALVEARRDMAASAPPLTPEERRALATGLRECAPTALDGAVAVLAAAAGIDVSRVPDILEVDLDGPDVPMLRRLLAYVRTAPKNALAAKKAAAAAAVEAAAAEAKAARKAAAAAARAPRAAANGGADAAAGEKRKRGRPPRKPEAAPPAVAAPAPPAADGDADMAPQPPPEAAADVAAEGTAGDAAAAAAAGEAPSAPHQQPPPPPTAPKTAEPSEELPPRREASPVPPPQLFSPPQQQQQAAAADAAARMDAEAAPPAPPAADAPAAPAADGGVEAMQA